MNLCDWARLLLSTRAPGFTFRLHHIVYRLTGGRFLATSGRMPVLSLTTTGRKTGKHHARLVSYFEDQGRFVLVASNVGRGRHPAWYLNLRAHPDASIQIGAAGTCVRAEIASESERARLWSIAARLDPLYSVYQQRTTRIIPVVILHPRAGISRDGE